MLGCDLLCCCFSLPLSPCDNKTKQNLRLDGSYDGGMGELGSSEVGEVGSGARRRINISSRPRCERGKHRMPNILTYFNGQGDLAAPCLFPLPYLPLLAIYNAHSDPCTMVIMATNVGITVSPPSPSSLWQSYLPHCNLYL